MIKCKNMKRPYISPESNIQSWTLLNPIADSINIVHHSGGNFNENEII